MVHLVRLALDRPLPRSALASKLRAEARTVRSPLLPNAPTFADLGVEGPGEVRGWLGALAPAGVPPAMAQKISQQIQRRSRELEIQTRLMNE